MLIRQSTLFGKARKEAPHEADSVSHKLLTRAGYIDQLGSGIFSLLPLGWRVHQRIEGIIRAHLATLDAQELFLPALHPARVWEESGRLTTMDPPLFQVMDRHKRLLVLASTHEEVITALAKKYIESYKDLPLSVYQIQTKFRNEMRSTGGLLRVREFQMKDLYSFHATQDDLSAFYEKVKQAYFGIFKDCDLKARAVVAHSGTIGGSVSHEFSTEAATGEDKVYACTQCEYAANSETVTGEAPECPQGHGALKLISCIENGHVFQLGTKYSERLGATFKTAMGDSRPLIMGCYGIGLGRLLAAIVETHHDDFGIVWPVNVSPFRVHVVPLQGHVKDEATIIAEKLSKKVDVLLDDRAISIGEKLNESDLLGISTRIVISDKTEKSGSAEFTDRQTRKSQLIAKESISEHLTSL